MLQNGRVTVELKTGAGGWLENLCAYSLQVESFVLPPTTPPPVYPAARRPPPPPACGLRRARFILYKIYRVPAFRNLGQWVAGRFQRRILREIFIRTLGLLARFLCSPSGTPQSRLPRSSPAEQHSGSLRCEWAPRQSPSVSSTISRQALFPPHLSTDTFRTSFLNMK